MKSKENIMIGPRKLFILLMVLSLFTLPNSAAAGNRVLSDVRVIHASTGSSHIDPGLRDLSTKLKSVFRYTSYRLIQQKRLHLKYNQTGTVSLPDRRTLKITPVSLTGGRIKFRIRIAKSGRQVFRTEVMLKKGSSITIGGPEFRGGVLLFNILGTF